jgi:hypothetical protein
MASFPFILSSVRPYQLAPFMQRNPRKTWRSPLLKAWKASALLAMAALSSWLAQTGKVAAPRAPGEIRRSKTLVGLIFMAKKEPITERSL